MAGGRPSKTESLLIRLACGEEIEEALKSVYARLDDRYGIDEGVGVSSKLAAVEDAIRKAYDEAAQAMGKSTFDEAMALP